MKAKAVRESSVTMSHMMMPQDANPAGIIHGGIVMKHIDDAAGVVALRHTRSVCVTASIDRIDFFNPVYIGDLLTLKASLNMVGSTSMEIGVRVESENLITGKILDDSFDNEAFTKKVGTLLLWAAQIWFGQTSCLDTTSIFGLISLYTFFHTKPKSNG